MKAPGSIVLPGDCYANPRYYDIAFQGDTALEADFIEKAAARFGRPRTRDLLEPGCGTGRLVAELAGRGFRVSGFDLSQPSLDFAAARLRRQTRQANLFVGDLADFRVSRQVDLAYCFCNTFRHLTTEEAARRHLELVADSLRRGGIYILGLHLLPPDAELEATERWTERRGAVTVTCTIRGFGVDRRRRIETLRTILKVDTPRRTLRIAGEHPMRIYLAAQLMTLLQSVAALELVSVHDFWLDIDEPLRLDNERGDVVLVLRKRG